MRHENYLVFAIDQGQDAEDFTEEFTGYYIRRATAAKFAVRLRVMLTYVRRLIDTIPTTPSPEGNLLLETALLIAGWTFESDTIVPEGEIPDANYMYFGYWLKSPVVVSDSPSSYLSATFSGGNDLFNVVAATDVLRITDNSHALTAKYEGGAAGRYVTRDLRVKLGDVDPNSPGSHGRFTAKAKLTATFGTHPSFAASEARCCTPVVESRQNVIQGTISDFKDGSIDLGFEVTLGMRDIEASEGGIGDAVGNGMVTATFGQNSDNGPTTGKWSGEFYGANAADAASDAVKNRTLPSGVAGEFDCRYRYRLYASCRRIRSGEDTIINWQLTGPRKA